MWVSVFVCVRVCVRACVCVRVCGVVCVCTWICCACMREKQRGNCMVRAEDRVRFAGMLMLVGSIRVSVTVRVHYRLG